MSRLNWPDDETLSLYVAGALPPQEAKRVGALVAEDPELAERVADESLLLAGLMDGSAVAPEADFWADLSTGIMARIDEEIAAETPPAVEAPKPTPRRRFTLLQGGGERPWLVPALGGVIAMAAALAMMVRAPSTVVEPTPGMGSAVALVKTPSPVESLSTDPAAFEGITIASLLADESSTDLGLFEDIGTMTVAQLTGEASGIENLDLGVEPIQILEDGDPESVQELSDDQIETLMLALDKAMMG